MGKYIINVILIIIINNIYHNLVYVERHPSNYLITSGKSPIYHLLFINGEAI
jgi:hypothetical protein